MYVCMPECVCVCVTGPPSLQEPTTPKVNSRSTPKTARRREGSSVCLLLFSLSVCFSVLCRVIGCLFCCLSFLSVFVCACVCFSRFGVCVMCVQGSDIGGSNSPPCWLQIFGVARGSTFPQMLFRRYEDVDNCFTFFL